MPNLNVDTYQFDFSGGGGVPEGYTYIVDSDQALNNWLHGISGNDYTHVFIAPGRWSIDYAQVETIKYLDDVSIGTKTITGVPGSVICDDDNDYTDLYDGFAILKYQTLPTKDYFIKGITFEFKKVMVYNSSDGYFTILSKCINIINCNILSISTRPSCSAPIACAYACTNISNCTFSTGYASTVTGGQGHIDAVQNCINIYNCIFNIINEAQNDASPSDNSFTFVSGCINIYNCVMFGELDSKLTRDSMPSGFWGCKNINNVIVYNAADYGDSIGMCAQVNNCIALFFGDNTAMSHCCGYTIDQYGYMSLAVAKSYRDYADHSRTVAAANNSAGGWNWVTSRY